VLCQFLILGWPCSNILVLLDRIAGAARQARAKYRDKLCHVIRVGFSTVYVRR